MQAQRYFGKADIIIDNSSQLDKEKLKQLGIQEELLENMLTNVITLRSLDYTDEDAAKTQIMLEIAEWL